MDVQNLIRKIEKSILVSFDTETVSLTDKTIVSYSICCDGETFFVPIAMNTMKNVSKKDNELILSAIINKNGVIYHHYHFDAQVLRKAGFTPTKLPHDTMIMAHLLNENRRLKLKTLVFEIFGYEMKTFKQVCGTGKKQISFADAPPELAKAYGVDDAEWTQKLYIHLNNKLMKSPDLKEAYESIERPLLLVVDAMHTVGVPIDKDKLEEIATLCQEKSHDYYEKIQYYMKGINLNSPLQLREYFINQRFQPILKRSRRTGEPSVDNEVLEKYADKCPEAGWILKYRYYSKILTTFIPALSPSNGNKRIYPHFHQVGTTSGRFSSSEPNFQNIPNEDKLGIRDCIKAPKGFVFIGADYSQMELRLAAHFSKDKTMRNIYNSGGDIHETTSKAVGCERRQAKVINFGILYGIGVKALSKNLDATYDEARKYIKGYYDTYPGVREFMLKARRTAVEKGFVKLYGGRHRNISKNFESKTEWEKGGELRSLSNAIIQGSGAMIIKDAMVKLSKSLKKFPQNEVKIIAQIHDELIIECAEKHVDVVKQIVKKCMIEPTKQLSVPFDVDVKSGRTWEEIH